MAGELTNEFLIAVKVTELNQVKELYQTILRLRELALKGIPDINVRVKESRTSTRSGGESTGGSATAKSGDATTAAAARAMEKAAGNLSAQAKAQADASQKQSRAAQDLTNAAKELRSAAEQMVQNFARTITGGHTKLTPYTSVSRALDTQDNARRVVDELRRRFQEAFGFGHPQPETRYGSGSVRNPIGPPRPPGPNYFPPEGQSPRALGSGAGKGYGVALEYYGPTNSYRATPPISAFKGFRGLFAEAQKDGFAELNGFAAKARQLMYYAIAGGIIYGAIAGIRKATSELTEFDFELSKIQGFFNDRSLNTRLKIEQGTIQAAKDFGVALGEVVRVTKFFAQAGFSPAESIKQTRATLRAASGLDIGPEAAAQTAIAAKEISRGRVSSEDLFERIAKIERLNAVTAEDLNVAVQRVGAFVSQLQPKGQGIVDAFDLVIGATTQIVETTRVSGNQAANALKFIVARLAAPEVASNLQNRYGIKLASNPEGTQFRPLVEILQEVASTYRRLKYGDPSKGIAPRTVEAAQLLSTIAGQRQIGLATALFDNFGKAMDVATQSALAFGDLQERLNLQLDTVRKRTEQFWASFLGFGNTFLKQTGAYGATKGLLRAGTAYFDEASNLGPLGGALGVAGLAFAGGKIVGGVRRLGQLKEVFGKLSALNSLRERGLLNDITLPFVTKSFKSVETIPPGLLKFGGIVSKIGEIFGPFTPLLVFAGLAGLASLIKFAIDASRQGTLSTIQRATAADVNATEFGKEFADKASTLGLTTPGLVNRVRSAVAASRSGLQAIGEAELKKKFVDQNPLIAALANPEYLNKVFQNTELNRQVRPLLEQVFTKQLLGGLNPAAIETLTGSKLQGEANNDQIALAQQLLRQSVQYVEAPGIIDQSNISKALANALGQLENVKLENVLNVGNRKSLLTVGGLSPAGFLPSGPTAPQEVINAAFKSFAISLQDLQVKVSDTSQDISALGVVTNETAGKTGDWVQALNDFFVKNYTPAGGLKGETISYNLEQLDKQSSRTIDAAIKSRLRGGNVADDLLGLKETPTTAAEILVQSLQRAAEKRQATVGINSAEGSLLSKFITTLGQEGPRYAAKVLNDIEVIATVKDRVAQVIEDFARKMLEIQAVTPVFERLGIGIDAAAETADVAKNTLRAFVSIPAQIEGDIVKQGLNLQQAQAILIGRTVPDASFNVDTVDENGTPLALDVINQERSRRAERFRAQTQRKIDLLRGQLEEFVGSKSLLSYVPEQDSRILENIVKQFTGNNDLSIVNANKEEITRILGVGYTRANAVAEARREASRLADLDLARTTREFDFRSQLRGIGANEAIATARRTGGPTASVGIELSEIQRRRFETQRAAVFTYANAVEDINRRKGLEDAEKLRAELEKAADTLEDSVKKAYDSSIVDMNRLLSEARQRILDDTAERIQSLINSGTSGLVNALKNPSVLFAEGKQNTFGTLARSIIEPVGSTILGNLVDNIASNLFDKGGLLNGPLAALFGVSEKQRQKYEELKLQRQATRDGTYDGVVDAMSDLGLGSVSPEQRLNSSFNSRIYGNSLLTTGIAGAFLPALFGTKLTGSQAAYTVNSGVPSILQGAYSPGGPNLNATGPLPSPGTGAADVTDRKKLLKQQLLLLGGIYGGTLLGGLVGGKGIAGSYASEGASIGGAIGSLIPGLGPVGGLVGGVFGGLFGGLFGKSEPPKPPRTPAVLDRIEQNTRVAATALENQNRNLFSLDSRLLNVPTGYTVPGYRPQDAGSTYNITIVSNNPAEVARRVEQVVSGQARRQGTFTSLRGV